MPTARLGLISPTSIDFRRYSTTMLILSEKELKFLVVAHHGRNLKKKPLTFF